MSGMGSGTSSLRETKPDPMPTADRDGQPYLKTRFARRRASVPGCMVRGVHRFVRQSPLRSGPGQGGEWLQGLASREALPTKTTNPENNMNISEYQLVIIHKHSLESLGVREPELVPRNETGEYRIEFRNGGLDWVLRLNPIKTPEAVEIEAELDLGRPLRPPAEERPDAPDQQRFQREWERRRRRAQGLYRSFDRDLPRARVLLRDLEPLKAPKLRCLFRADYNRPGKWPTQSEVTEYLRQTLGAAREAVARGGG